MDIRGMPPVLPFGDSDECIELPRVNILRLDGRIPKSLLKHVADMTRPRIVPARIRYGYRMHRVALAVVRIVDEQMNMVSHKAPSDKLNIVFGEDRIKDLKQGDSVLGIVKQQLPSVSTQRDVEITGW